VATATEIRRFAQEHRHLLTYGPSFNRGGCDAVARTWDVVTRPGREDGADYLI
jgi:hypothetical protein